MTKMHMTANGVYAEEKAGVWFREDFLDNTAILFKLKEKVNTRGKRVLVNDKMIRLDNMSSEEVSAVHKTVVATDAVSDVSGVLHSIARGEG